MARGDVKNTRLTLYYNQYAALQPPSGETWLVTGMVSHWAGISVFNQNNNNLYIHNSSDNATYSVMAFPPTKGGLKILINNSNYINFLYTDTTNTPKYCTIYAIEV